MLLRVALLLALCACADAHGRLTRPRRRRHKDGTYFPNAPDGAFTISEEIDALDQGWDEDAPLNFNCDDCAEAFRLPVNDPSKHQFKESFSCRVQNGDVQPGRVQTVTAGTKMEVKYLLTAAHPGNADLFISYDWDFADTTAMRWFKIAQFPQTSCTAGQLLHVNLPAWLPAGRAVMRWGWYALHTMDVAVEFFVSCSDIQIVSSSTVSVETIPKYTLEVDGRGGGRDYDPNSASKGYFSYPFKDYRGRTYWQYYDEPRNGPHPSWTHIGPPCVGGVEGNCCDLDLFKRSGAIVHPNGPDCPAASGFNVCANAGSSGPAAFLDGVLPRPPTGGERLSSPPPSASPSPPPSRVWVLGDSFAAAGDWGGGGGGAIADMLCSGGTVVNDAVGGSTAEEWNTGSYWPPTPSPLPDRAWLSVGANDWHDWCSYRPSKAGWVQNMRGALSRLHDKLPGAPVLLFGYTYPTEWHCDKAQYDQFLESVRSLAEEDPLVTWVDIRSVLSRSPAGPSQTTYFADTIHPNDVGHAKIFSTAAVADFFSCGGSGGGGGGGGGGGNPGSSDGRQHATEEPGSEGAGPEMTYYIAAAVAAALLIAAIASAITYARCRRAASARKTRQVGPRNSTQPQQEALDKARSRYTQRQAALQGCPGAMVARMQRGASDASLHAVVGKDEIQPYRPSEQHLQVQSIRSSAGGYPATTVSGRV